MSDSDILERAKAIHEKYASRDESIDEVFQAHLAADLLPELIAEVERRRAENKIISDRAANHDRQDAKEIELLAARIAELEAGKLMYEEIAESYQIGVMEMTEECPLCNRLRRRHLGDLCPKHFAERLLARFEQLRAGGKDEA